MLLFVNTQSYEDSAYSQSYGLGMKIGDIIKRKREALELSQKQLGDAVGVSQVAIAKIEKGLSAKSRYLQDIVEYLGIESVDRKNVVSAKAGEIAEIDVRAGAGGGGLPLAVTDDFGAVLDVDGEGVKASWRLPDEILSRDLGSKAEHLKVFEVVGDSMEPRLSEGDRVFVDTRFRFPSPEGMFALWDGYGIVIKRVEIVRGSEPLRIRIISANASYSVYEATEDEVRIIGRYAGRFTTN